MQQPTEKQWYVSDNSIQRLSVCGFVFLSTLIISSCGSEVGRDDMIGTWIHTQEVEIPSQDDREIRTYLRRDNLVLRDDGTYSRSFSSRIPGEEESFTHTGSWRLSGRTLTLTYTKNDGSVGKAKGRVQIVDEYSIRWGGRFFGKAQRPRSRPHSISSLQNHHSKHEKNRYDMRFVTRYGKATVQGKGALSTGQRMIANLPTFLT